MNVYVALILVTAAWISFILCGVYLVSFIKAMHDGYCFEISSILIFIACCIIAAIDILFLCFH